MFCSLNLEITISSEKQVEEESVIPAASISFPY